MKVLFMYIIAKFIFSITVYCVYEFLLVKKILEVLKSIFCCEIVMTDKTFDSK